MGGSDIEVTLIDVINGLYRRVDSLSTFEIGGDTFTEIVINILCEEFKRKHKSSPIDNKRSMSKLKSNAESLKSILSTMERAHCSIDALFDGIDFDYYLTRQRFEASCSKSFESCLQPIDTLLQTNNIDPIQIDKVILCGAPTKMCKLQSLIKDKFPPTTRILSHLQPDEIIALGCAKQSVVISNTKCNKLNTNDNLFRCLANEIYMKVFWFFFGLDNILFYRFRMKIVTMK